MSRPKTFIDSARLEKLAAAGVGLMEACAVLGVAYPTLYQRMKQEPELRAAYERGKERSAAKKPRRAFRPLPAEAQTPAPPRPAAVPPPVLTGTPSQRVLESIRLGHRTYGRLMFATGLTHDALVVEVGRLMQRGAVYARSVGGARQHFLSGEGAAASCAAAPVETSEAL